MKTAKWRSHHFMAVILLISLGISSLNLSLGDDQRVPFDDSDWKVEKQRVHPELFAGDRTNLGVNASHDEISDNFGQTANAIHETGEKESNQSPKGVKHAAPTVTGPNKNQSDFLPSRTVSVFSQEKVKEGTKYVASNTINTAKSISRMIQDSDLLFHSDPKDGRPPFESVVDSSGQVIGNVSGVLDFVIAGFGKCGTTTMMTWLGSHEQVQIFPRECYELIKDQPGNLLRKIYKLPPGNFLRGYKSPSDILMPGPVLSYGKYFPRTKIIIGIRHPVKWFESLYNFRVQNLRPDYNWTHLPHPNELIGYPNGECPFNACTIKGNMALFLRQLGKSKTVGKNVTQFENLMYKAAGLPLMDLPPVPNPIFLFEVAQLKDTNATRSSQFRLDLEEFMGLTTPLPPVHHERPGKLWEDPILQKERDEHKIDICESKHDKVRYDLMRIARTSSVWIREYLLHGTEHDQRKRGVFVSSPAFLRRAVEDWMWDPCDYGRDSTANAGWRTLFGEPGAQAFFDGKYTKLNDEKWQT